MFLFSFCCLDPVEGYRFHLLFWWWITVLEDMYQPPNILPGLLREPEMRVSQNSKEHGDSEHCNQASPAEPVLSLSKERNSVQGGSPGSVSTFLQTAEPAKLAIYL
jgi:hypothetical protein